LNDPAYLATGRMDSLFAPDWQVAKDRLRDAFEGASVLVVGGAGTIGAATVRRLLSLKPKRIHVADTDENGLARLTRAIMADGRPEAELFYLAADMAGFPMRAHLAAEGPFDVVLDFAAVKHVRSEKSLAALLHLVDVNIVKQAAFFRAIEETGATKRLFAVSTDKAADPANFMGASKRLLEEVLYRAGRRSGAVTASARFANVAFSAGSLLESFAIRHAARRPLAAPRSTRRFFISADEASQICLIGAAACPAGLALVPRPTPHLPPTEMADVAARFLESVGETPVFFEDFGKAERHLRDGIPGYPVVLTPLDTVGEKDEEIFVAPDEEARDIGLPGLIAVKAPAASDATVDAVVDELAQRTSGQLATAGAADVEMAMRRVVTNFRRAGGTLNLDDRV